MPSTLYNPDGSRTGVRINARSRRTKHMGGEPTSGLFTQPTKSEQIAISERARARRDAAAASTASAPAASAPAVKKPDGMLVPGRGGSSVWKTQDQIKADAEKSASRAAARRSMSDRDKAVLETQQLRKTQDRNFSRMRVAREKIHGESTTKGFWSVIRDNRRADGRLNQRDPEVERVLNES